jgi:hypothetical protein
MPTITILQYEENKLVFILLNEYLLNISNNKTQLDNIITQLPTMNYNSYNSEIIKTIINNKDSLREILIDISNLQNTINSINSYYNNNLIPDNIDVDFLNNNQNYVKNILVEIQKFINTNKPIILWLLTQ